MVAVVLVLMLVLVLVLASGGAGAGADGAGGANGVHHGRRYRRDMYMCMARKWHVHVHVRGWCVACAWHVCHPHRCFVLWTTRTGPANPSLPSCASPSSRVATTRLPPEAGLGAGVGAEHPCTMHVLNHAQAMHMPCVYHACTMHIPRR